MTPAELEAALARRSAEELRRFPPELLARIALLPEWTPGLALLPEDMIQALEDAGLTESRTLLSGERSSWLRSSRRREVGEFLRREHGTLVERELERMLGWTSQVPGLDEWRAVVTVHRADASGLSLLNAVAAAANVGAASRLVATAQLLGEVLGGPLEGSARRARRRVDRAMREAEDARFLRHYRNRAEFESAVETLLSPGAPRWALHLLGAGGAGKTMLVRYLAGGRFAAERGLPEIPVARVDFDHLDPRYPEARPGEVLLALAGELLGFGVTREVEGRYRRFLDAAGELHEESSRGVRLTGRERPLIEGMAAAFASFVESLGAPYVLLVLDTCEELAKLHPPGSPAPAIETTWNLLEQVHRRAPSVRALLAGRRRLVPPPDGTPYAGPELSRKDFVAVHLISGFTPEEAEEYLAFREVPEPLVPAVLARASAGDRVNPFDLSAYAEWALSDPTLDPAELLAAPGDPYVERRLIGRLGDQGVNRALAVAAELGRFDLPLVRPALTRLNLDPEAVFLGLAAQEWMRVAGLDETGRPEILEIEDHLRDRVRRVASARFPVNTRRLGQDAADVIDAAPSLTEVSAATVIAAVRLSADPGASWQLLEERVARENAWAWAGQVAARVAAEAPGTILGAVFATQAAARIHTGGGGVAGLWSQVEAHAHRHPDPRAARILADRAFLGLAACGHQVGLGERLPEIAGRGEAPSGSIVAALDGYLTWGAWEELRDEDVAAASGEGTFAEGLGPITHFAMTPRGDRLAAAHGSRLLTSWHVVDGLSAQWRGAYPRGIDAVALSPAGDSPVVAMDRTLALDGVSPTVTTPSRITCLAAAPDAPWVAAGHQNGEVSAWNLDGSRHTWGGSDRRALPGNRSPIADLCVAPGNTWLASVAKDGRVRVWNMDGTLRTILSALRVGPEHAVRVHASPDGTCILTAGRDGLLRLFLADGTQIGVADRPVVPYGVADPGPHRLTATAGARIVRWDGERVGSVMAAPTAAGVVAPDGTWFSGTGDGGARTWTPDRRLLAATLGQRALLAWQRGDLELARGLSEEAVRAYPDDSGDGIGKWTDWRPPPGLASRLLLLRDVLSEEPEVRRWSDLPPEAITDIDTERLHAWRVAAGNGERPPEPEVLDLLTRRDAYSASRRPATWLHHVTPSLVEAVAEAWRIRGEPERAAALLRDRIEEAVATGDDPDTVERCQIALIRLARRMRSLDLFPETTALARSGTPLVQAEAWITLALCTGEQPSSPAQAGSWYGWWQAQDRHSLAGGWPPAPRLAAEPGIPWSIAGRAVEEYAAAHDPDLVIAPPGHPRPVLPGRGNRARALVADAEILAMRDPEEAIPRLAQAAGLFRELGSPVEACQSELIALLAARRLSPTGPPPAETHVADQDVERLPSAWRYRHRMLRFHPGEEVILGDGDPVELRFGAPLIRPAEERNTFARVGRVERLVARVCPVTVSVSSDARYHRVTEYRPHLLVRWGPGWRLPLGGVLRLRVSADLDSAPWELEMWDHGSMAFRDVPGLLPGGRPETVPAEEDPHSPLVHLQGTAVQTSAGVRLRLTGETALTAPHRFSPRYRSLVVLQPEVVDSGPRELSQAERGRFTGLARDFAAQKAEAVLVLPLLPDAVSDAVRRVIAGCRTRPKDLLRLQRTIRGLIFEAGGDRAAAADVILFLRTKKDEYVAPH
ncbi:hypothetical protein [Herbidospora cretacea]|uniref:hypothetical protein n=1 Tax=Herbidospora cretacea TaxID=28444 RepID=UPI000772F82B|nr:hypothetical protein [Herbidospora cretacea]